MFSFQFFAQAGGNQLKKTGERVFRKAVEAEVAVEATPNDAVNAGLKQNTNSF